MDVLVSVLAAVLASSVVAAVVAGIFSDRTERRKQLRDQRIAVAGDFAGNAMAALAVIRDYKPTTRLGHRNERLHVDSVVREERAQATKDAVDKLRPMRGRVWVLFPGRSESRELAERGPKTTADWAETVVGRLRAVEEVCEEFWSTSAIEGRDTGAWSGRAAEEQKFVQRYESAKSASWHAVDGFTDSAARRLEPSTTFWRPTGRRQQGTVN